MNVYFSDTIEKLKTHVCRLPLPYKLWDNCFLSLWIKILLKWLFLQVICQELNWLIIIIIISAQIWKTSIYTCICRICKYKMDVTASFMNKTQKVCRINIFWIYIIHLQTSDPLSAGMLSDIYRHSAPDTSLMWHTGPHPQDEMSGLDIIIQVQTFRVIKT